MAIFVNQTAVFGGWLGWKCSKRLFGMSDAKIANSNAFHRKDAKNKKI